MTELKGRQLEYIKTHAKLILGLIIGFIVLVIFFIYLLCEFVEWKENYTKLWEDKSRVETDVGELKKEVKRLIDNQ